LAVRRVPTALALVFLFLFFALLLLGRLAALKVKVDGYIMAGWVRSEI
jgi:hypothetical protein